MPVNSGAHFKDRHDAGKKLSELLLKNRVRYEKPIVLGLPPGGVTVAYEVAARLRAPLDVVVSRKLCSRAHPESGFGAIAPGDIVIIDMGNARRLALAQEDINSAIDREMREMEMRLDHYRSGEWGRDEDYATVILIDDGCSSSVAVSAAIESAKFAYRPERIVFASPVCTAPAAAAVRRFADEVVCLSMPRIAFSKTMSYEQFAEVSDAEVLTYLRRAQTERNEGNTKAEERVPSAARP